MWPYASFYKVYSLQHGNFFHTYDYGSLVSFNISFRIEKLASLHYILQLFAIYHIDM